jgi:hypothetical protein
LTRRQAHLLKTKRRKNSKSGWAYNDRARAE